MLEAFNTPVEAENPPPSLFELLRQLNQPQTRRGFSRLLQAVNALGTSAEEPI
jgi:uncharacterized protein YjgD (DUF1641 family)